MPAILKNNAVSRLAGAISASTTSISVLAGDGAKFPAPGAGQWFPLTLIKASGATEIVNATSRSGDVIAVSRGAEGTSPLSFAAGDRVELRITAEVLNAKMERVNGEVAGGLRVAGDIVAYRPASPGTGVIYLREDGSRYLWFDGGNYQMPGSNLYVNGAQVWSTANFNPASYLPLTGGQLSGGLHFVNDALYISHTDTNAGIVRHIHANDGHIGFLTHAGGWACYSQNDGSFIASGNIAAYSDIKHKTDILTIEDGLALVERLRGVRYTRKSDGSRRIGLIAQEAQEVLPEVVGDTVDGLCVDYGNVVAPLIEAVKQLADRVRKLEGQ